ncbi:MAG: hypothetical protein ACK4VI_06980 [Alphaproteobacteria bacterium]
MILKKYLSNDLPRPRKILRQVLLCTLLLSTVFCAAMITLKVNRSAHWYVAQNYQTEIFHTDIAIHKFRASFQNDEKQYQTALTLLNKGLFSRLYRVAGLKMLKDIADDGYAPAQTLYGDILIYSANSIDQRTEAAKYYAMAAAQNYAPAIEKIAQNSQ